MSHALWWRCTCSPEALQLLYTSMHYIQLNKQVGWLANYSTSLSAGGQSPVSFIWEEEAVVGTLFTHHCFRLCLVQGKVSLFRIRRPKVLGCYVHNTHLLRTLCTHHGFDFETFIICPLIQFQV